MLIETLPVGVFQCNCTILACEATGEAIVADPGDEPDRILDAIRANGLKVVLVVHTHAHIDHIMGTRGVVQATGAPARLHDADRFLYDNLAMQGAFLGIDPEAVPPPAAPLQDGEVLAFGRETARVLHTPGHTPGSVCFSLDLGKQGLLVLSGDTLFRGGIGRTDLLGGDYDAELASIRDRLLPLDDDTRVIPGHGPETRIGLERRKNPFLVDLATS